MILVQEYRHSKVADALFKDRRMLRELDSMNVPIGTKSALDLLNRSTCRQCSIPKISFMPQHFAVHHANKVLFHLARVDVHILHFVLLWYTRHNEHPLAIQRGVPSKREGADLEQRGFFADDPVLFVVTTGLTDRLHQLHATRS